MKKRREGRCAESLNNTCETLKSVCFLGLSKTVVPNTVGVVRCSKQSQPCCPRMSVYLKILLVVDTSEIAIQAARRLLPCHV